MPTLELSMSDFGDLPRMQGRVQVAHGTGGGQPSAELIAHLVVALSRYRRQLRTDGVRIPAQIEDLITFLADPIRAPQVPMLDPWRGASDPSAMPRRLLITKSDAAELLGVSLRTIERLISAGRLPLVHVEGAARVRVIDLEAYVQGLETHCGTQPTPSSPTYESPAPPPSSQHHDGPPEPSAPRSTSIT
jgi:excisionase family DNA binding protein